MDKKTIIIIIAAVVLLVIIGLGFWGYLYLKKSKAESDLRALEKAGEAAETITESAAKGVLPSLTVDPLENKPDLNPADKANPFKNIKTNPF